MAYSGDRQTKESSIEKPQAAIEPIVRSMSVRLSPMLAAQWNSGSVVYSQLFNALSIFLPGGEDFFIRAMTLSCKARGPSTESKKVGAFARQESNHRKNHELYNACIAQSLPSVARSLRRMERRWKTVRLVVGRAEIIEIARPPLQDIGMCNYAVENRNDSYCTRAARAVSGLGNDWYHGASIFQCAGIKPAPTAHRRQFQG